MSQLYYTTCNPITVGCQLFQDSGTTTSVSAGYYSNGNDCYTVNSSGFVDSISTCLCSSCDELYVWSAYNESCCYRIETTGATAPLSVINLSGTSNSVYSTFGTRFFSQGFALDGLGTVDVTIATPIAGGSYVGTLWGNPSSNSTDGPLNRNALWTNPYGSEPTGVWLGFSVCLTGLTAEKIYYVGLGADNEFRLKVDGTEVLNTEGNIWTDQQFKWWNVYPILIGAGDHTLEIFGMNNESAAGFGCEVYDNTLQQLTGFSTYNQIDVLFTTSGQTQATILQSGDTYLSSGFTCPSGFTYSECDGDCTKYVFCCGPTPTPSPTPSPTPTGTLTATPTPSPTFTPTGTLEPTPTATVAESIYVHAKFVNMTADLQFQINGGDQNLIGTIDSLSCTYFYTITGLTNGDSVVFTTLSAYSIAGSTSDCPISTGGCNYTYVYGGPTTVYITVDGSIAC